MKDAGTRQGWRSWTGYCAGVAILFFLRGLVLVGFSPPFEGFDEPVHVAYLVHLDEVGTLPQFGTTMIPLSLYEEIVAYPHPKVSMKVVGRLGGSSYADYYDSDPHLISEEPLPLYQAQHPPLYYLLHQGVFAALHRTQGIVAAIGILRVLNLGFAALAIALFIYPLRGVLPDLPTARLGALAIGLFPMTVIYVARVGNDSLAMLFFAAAFLVLAGIDGESGLRTRAGTAGVLIGVGTLTKLIAFLMLPAGAAYLVWLALLGCLSWRKAGTALALLLAGYLFVCWHHHLVNLQQFGTWFSEAGTVINRDAGAATGSVLANIRLQHLWEFFLVHLVKSNLWMSGWSYLPPHPLLEWAWVGLLVVCLAGIVPLGRQVLRRERRLTDRPLRIGVLCLLVVGAVFAGTYAHALNSLSAWGGITTPQYYTIAGYPALLALAFLLLESFGRRWLVTTVVGGLCAVFLLTETVSLLRRSLPCWAASTDPGQIFQRLGQLHWVFPSPVTSVAAAVAAALVLVLLLKALRPNPIRGGDG